MRVFVTGATGFIGSAIVQELIGARHRVLGLARTEAAAGKLVAAGAEVHRGDLEDLDSLRSGAAGADGVIHTGFVHDFSRFQEVCEIDRRAIEAIGGALAGSGRPFVVTSGTGVAASGLPFAEQDTNAFRNPRGASEEAADAVSALGVRTAVVRLPRSVHGPGDHHGFVSILIRMARDKGVAAYIGDGLNRWPAVHRLDAARLYRLILEQSPPAGSRWHGVGDEGVALRTIAEVIARHLGIGAVSLSPGDAANHFGWFAQLAGLDCPASATQTQAQLAWQIAHPGLIADMESGHYFGI